MGYKRRELLDAEAGVYRFDALIVLKNTQMPAVLLEAGSIVNRDEELAMGSPERQSIISAAVAEAVETFCSAQSPPLAQQLARNPRDGQVARPRSTRNGSNTAGEWNRVMGGGGLLLAARRRWPAWPG